MVDPEAAKKSLENLKIEIKAEEIRVRNIARAEAFEQRKELEEEVNKTVEAIARSLAVLQETVLVNRSNITRLEQELATLRRDLRWLLTIPRAYHFLREQFVRLVPYRSARRFLAIAAPVATIVQAAFGWRQVFSWLAKIFTGQ